MKILTPALIEPGESPAYFPHDPSMSASANTQVHVPRPKVWQAFEKGSAYLWRKILKDPSLHRFGRNGQAQHGMDMFGYLRLLHHLSDAPISVGMWTRLVSDNGQVNEFVVVDGPGDPAAGKYGSTHSIAGAAIGHRAGETIIVEDRLGRSVRWTVEQVQHRYLHAYVDLTENFNTRFPKEDGFLVIRTTENDIEPFLDVMRRQSEQTQKILDNYARTSAHLCHCRVVWWA
jgi:hypothetical protein